MKILIADDETAALHSIERAVREVLPDAEIRIFSLAAEALAEIAEKGFRPDAAFLDIKMPGITGLELAKQVREQSPRTNVIFVTAYSDYALDAMTLHPSGYLMKPATAEKVRLELENLRYPPSPGPAHRVRVQCFGNFEVFADEKPLVFCYQKTKELLAYLVDRNGATCTNGEMLAVLWEDKPDTASLHSHLRNLIFDLSHTLEDAGVRGLLVRGRSTLAIDTSKVECDYYNFLRRDRSTISSYRGEYMTQYSWAEVTRSALRQQAAARQKGGLPSYYVPPTGF